MLSSRFKIVTKLGQWKKMSTACDWRSYVTIDTNERKKIAKSFKKTK